MNNYKPILTFIAILFSFLACSSPTNNEQELSLIKGSVFDVFMNDTLKIRPSSLIIDGNPIGLNEQLEFNVDLYPGEYPIRVESDDHFLLDTVITISESDSSLSLELKPLMLDYYATDIGDTWTFDFIDTAPYYGGDPIKNYYKGEMTWEIIRDSISTETQDTVLIVEQNLKGYRIEVAFGDTTENYYSEEKYHFNIYLEPNGFIRYSNIKSFDYSWDGTGSAFQVINEDGSKGRYIGFRDYKRTARYFPASRAKGKKIDITTYWAADCHVIIGFGKGFLGEGCYNIGNTRGGFSATLKNFESN